MIKLTVLSVVCSLASAAGASAAIAPVPLISPGSGIIQVGEGCGPGSWRGPDNFCRPFNTPYGSNRGSRFECPPGWHIGPGGRRCFPNR